MTVVGLCDDSIVIFGFNKHLLRPIAAGSDRLPLNRHRQVILAFLVSVFTHTLA